MDDGDKEAKKYLADNKVYALVNDALDALIAAKPRCPGMWLGHYFADEPSAENLLERLELMEQDLAQLETANAELLSRVQATSTDDVSGIGGAPPRASSAKLDLDDSTHTVDGGKDLVVDDVSLQHADVEDNQNFDWVTAPSSPIFEKTMKELQLTLDHTLVGPAGRHEKSIHVDSTTGLLVLGMQNDYCRGDSYNTGGGRHIIPESNEIAWNIAAMIDEVLAMEGSVVGVREYKPYNHVSFLGEGGGLYPHCVQGSEGSAYYAPVCEALRRGMDSDVGTMPRVHLAFNNVHPLIDAVSVLDPVRLREPTHNFVENDDKEELIKRWHGARMLSCADSYGKWAIRAEMCDPQTPPTVEVVEPNDPEDSCTRLSHWVAGVDTLIICGVPLETTVIETAIAAAEARDGPSTVYIVIDACRPRHVPGFGPYGTPKGFLSDLQQRVMQPAERMRKIRFISTAHVVMGAKRAKLERRLREEFPPWDPPVGAPFPEGCGPFGIWKANVVLGGIKIQTPPTEDADGVYDLGGAAMFAALQDYGVKMQGTLSPRSPLSYLAVERLRISVPPEADSWCWAYPLDGMGSLLFDSSAEMSKYVRTPKHGPVSPKAGEEAILSPSTLSLRNSALSHIDTEKLMQIFQSTLNPNFSFAVIGGFLYLKGDKVVGTNALCWVGGSVCFEAKQKIPDDAKFKLVDQERFHDITITALLEDGGRKFAWIKPKEIKGFDHGGFAYLMKKDIGVDNSESDGGDVLRTEGRSALRSTTPRRLSSPSAAHARPGSRGSPRRGSTQKKRASSASRERKNHDKFETEGIWFPMVDLAISTKWRRGWMFDD